MDTVTLEIISVSVIALLLLWREMAIFWGEIISDCYPMPLLAGTIGGSLLLIAFVISFHSNVFTENDRYNIVKSEERVKGNGYNWIDLVDVYRFPLDQIVHESYFHKVNHFDFSPKLEPTQNYHLIVVDKTTSTFESGYTKKLLISAKKLLKDEVEKTSPESGRTLDNLKSFADIIAISCAIDAIVQGKSQVKIGFYRGRDSEGNDTRYMDYIVYDPIHETLDSFIKKYYSESIRKSAPQHHSDFTQLFEHIANNGLALRNDQKMDVILTVISDFVDDYPLYEKKNLINQLYSISNVKLKQLNSFVLTGTNPISMEGTHIDHEVLNSVKGVFAQISWLEVCNEKELCEDTKNRLINIVTNPNRPLGNEQEISALASFDSPYNLRTGKATIHLMNKDTLCQDPVTICLKPTNIGTEEVVERVGIGDENIPLILNEYKTLPFKDGKVDLVFPKQLSKSDEYYLNIYSIKHKKKITTPLVFREQLTTTSSIMLVFLYSLLYSAAIAFLSILGWSFGCYAWVKMPVRWQIIGGILFGFAVAAPAMYILIMALCNIFSILNYSNDLATRAFWVGIMPFLFIALLLGLNGKSIHQKIISLI